VRRQRVQALLTEIDRLSRLTDVEFESLMDSLLKITKYNQNWLKSRKMKENLRDQGEYALSLSNERVYDYSTLLTELESALETVNAPKCDYISNLAKCDPPCKKADADSEDEELKSVAKTTDDSEKKDIEIGHKLVFENDKGEVVVIGNQVVKSDGEVEVDEGGDEKKESEEGNEDANVDNDQDNEESNEVEENKKNEDEELPSENDETNADGGSGDSSDVTTTVDEEGEEENRRLRRRGRKS